MGMKGIEELSDSKVIMRNAEKFLVIVILHRSPPNICELLWLVFWKVQKWYPIAFSLHFNKAFLLLYWLVFLNHSWGEE